MICNGSLIIQPRPTGVIWHNDLGLKALAPSNEIKRDHPQHWAIMDRLTSFTFDQGTERKIAQVIDGALHLNSIGLLQLMALHVHTIRTDLTFDPDRDLKAYFEPGLSLNSAIDWCQDVLPNLLNHSSADDLPIGSIERYALGVERGQRGSFWEIQAAMLEG